MLTKRLFNSGRRDQSTVDFLGIDGSTQNMQEPISVQTAEIAGMIPSLSETPGAQTRVVTKSARHGRRPHFDNPDLSGIRQEPVGPPKPNGAYGLSADGRG